MGCCTEARGLLYCRWVETGRNAAVNSGNAAVGSQNEAVRSQNEAVNLQNEAVAARRFMV